MSSALHARPRPHTLFAPQALAISHLAETKSGGQSPPETLQAYIPELGLSREAPCGAGREMAQQVERDPAQGHERQRKLRTLWRKQRPLPNLGAGIPAVETQASLPVPICARPPFPSGSPGQEPPGPTRPVPRRCLGSTFSLRSPRAGSGAVAGARHQRRQHQQMLRSGRDSLSPWLLITSQLLYLFLIAPIANYHKFSGSEPPFFFLAHGSVIWVSSAVSL